MEMEFSLRWRWGQRCTGGAGSQTRRPLICPRTFPLRDGENLDLVIAHHDYVPRGIAN